MSNKVQIDAELANVYIQLANGIMHKMSALFAYINDNVSPAVGKVGGVAKEGTKVKPEDTVEILKVAKDLSQETTALLDALRGEMSLLTELAGDAGTLSTIGQALFNGDTLADLRARGPRKSAEEVVSDEVSRLFNDMDKDTQN